MKNSLLKTIMECRDTIDKDITDANLRIYPIVEDFEESMNRFINHMMDASQRYCLQHDTNESPLSFNWYDVKAKAKGK